MIYFRFPFTTQIWTTDQNTNLDPVQFVSFDKKETISFSGNITEVISDDFINSPLFSADLSSELNDFEEEIQADYIEKLNKVISFININNLPKLVISRRKLVGINSEKINLSQTFLNLCEAYPNAFVYFFIKNEKCWIGAFSEVLGRFEKETNDFQTMSLAGTIPIAEEWTTKEIEEQQPVTDFIADILERYSDQFDQSKTTDHLSGNIKHLRTDFKAKIKTEELEEVISELHPTPAVCGIPKKKCMEAIANFEENPRHFYGGYIKVETTETIQYFVNLRCAEFFKNAALLYVGGGITADSSPEKEWQETELKSEAMMKNLSFVEK